MFANPEEISMKMSSEFSRESVEAVFINLVDVYANVRERYARVNVPCFADWWTRPSVHSRGA